MSGGTSDQQSSSQNIGTAFLANLFGQGAGFDKSGVVFNNSGTGAGGQGSGGKGGAGGGGGGQNFAQQVFQPSDFGSLRNLLEPTSRNVLQDVAGPMGLRGVEAFSRTYDSLLGPGTEAISEGLNTGFRTDMAPIVAAEKRRFARQTVPDLVEQYAGLTGGFSSGIQNALAGAAGDLGVTLGSKQAELDEASNARRLQALSLGPSAASAIAGMPTNAASDILGLGAQIQEDEFLSRPEVQLMRNLSSIFSLSPPTIGSQGSSKQMGLV